MSRFTTAGKQLSEQLSKVRHDVQTARSMHARECWAPAIIINHHPTGTLLSWEGEGASRGQQGSARGDGGGPGGSIRCEGEEGQAGGSQVRGEGSGGSTGVNQV